MTRNRKQSLLDFPSARAGVALPRIVMLGGFAVALALGAALFEVNIYVGISVGISAGVGVATFLCCFIPLVPYRPSELLDVVSLLRFKLRGFSARSLTGLAVLLAGRRRPALQDEWHAHLAGDSGHDSATWSKVRQALGFVAAAIQLRLADAADLAWRPVDAVLRSRTLSNLLVGGPIIVMLFAIVHHDGRFGLVTDIQDAGELGAFLYGVIRVGRWWRAVKLPEPKPRRAKE